MYGLKNVWDKQPVTIVAAIMGWVNFALILGWVTFSDPATAIPALNGALLATGALFINSKTTNKAGLAEVVKAQEPDEPAPPADDQVPFAWPDEDERIDQRPLRADAAPGDFD